MAAPSLPILFGGILAGAVIIDYGVKNMRTAFGATASGAPAGEVQGGRDVRLPGKGGGGLPASGGHGLVTNKLLTEIGAAHGWSGSQLADWMNVIMAESNGTLTDTNPGSGAYGIAQFINGPSEYYNYGGTPNTVVGQLTAMANYIAQRYGNPSTAWAFHQAHNWY